MSSNKVSFLVVAVLFLFLAFLTYYMLRFFPVWWDEGWTLSVAKNWALDGHFGRYLLGERISPFLAASYPVTGSVALSFSLFGVGLLQGRGAILVFALLSIVLLYLITRKLYSRKSAYAAVLIVLFASGHYKIHPLFLGAQTLAEMPTIFFVLAGYCALMLAPRRPTLGTILTIFFWGAAFIIKIQPKPFLFLALLLPCAFAFFCSRRRLALRYLLLVCLTPLAAYLLKSAEPFVTGAEILPSPDMKDLYQTTALNFTWGARRLALQVAVLHGALLCIGLLWFVPIFFKEQWRSLDDKQFEKKLIELSLFIFTASWCGWYVCSSVGWWRYFAVPYFFSSIFAARFLEKVTHGFRLRETIAKSFISFRELRLPRGGEFAALLAVGLVVFSVLTTVRDYQTLFSVVEEGMLGRRERLLERLNTETPEDTVIETYEAELLFQLDRAYHYPSDEVHIALNMKRSLDSSKRVEYDFLKADPEYIILGSFGTMWGVYSEAIIQREFQFLGDDGRYRLYQRRRQAPVKELKKKTVRTERD